MEQAMQSRTATMSTWILSIVFHPAFLPVYGILIILGAPTFLYYLPFGIKRIIFMLVAINMTVVPLALMPVLKYRGIISTWSVDKRSERILPLGMGTLMYAITTIIFYSYQIPVLIKSFMIGTTIISVLVLIVTFFWKISLHAAGVGGLLATIIALSLRLNADLQGLWIPMTILCGLVLTARLAAGSHNSLQVYGGFIAGFLSIFLSMMTI